MIVQIRQGGISTHPISIWIDEDDITAVNEIGEGEGERMGKLSRAQLESLRKIIE